MNRAEKLTISYFVTIIIAAIIIFTSNLGISSFRTTDLIFFVLAAGLHWFFFYKMFEFFELFDEVLN